MDAKRIIGLFGGQSALARDLGHRNPTTVASWAQRGNIPTWHHGELLKLAKRKGIDLSPLDFFDRALLAEVDGTDRSEDAAA